MKSKPTTTI